MFNTFHARHMKHAKRHETRMFHVARTLINTGRKRFINEMLGNRAVSVFNKGALIPLVPLSRILYIVFGGAR